MGIKNPRQNLTEKQNEMLNSFILKINETTTIDEKQRSFAKEDCLVRYLRARDFNIDKAYKMLMNTLEWRKSFKPAQIDPHTLKEQATSGKCYVGSKDIEGKPFIIMTPRRESSDDWEANIKWTMYLIERAIHETPDGQEKINLLIDFDGYSKKNSPPMWVSKEILSILSNHYPERLNRAYFLSTPWVFSFFWAIIKQFVDPVTKEKVKFINGKPKELAKQLLSSGINIEEIEDRFGGTKEQPEPMKYWQQECERYEQIQKAFKQRTDFHIRTASISSIESLD